MERSLHFLKTYIHFFACVPNDFPVWSWLTPLNALIPAKGSPSWVTPQESLQNSIRTPQTLLRNCPLLSLRLDLRVCSQRKKKKGVLSLTFLPAQQQNTTAAALKMSARDCPRENNFRLKMFSQGPEWVRLSQMLRTLCIRTLSVFHLHSASGSPSSVTLTSQLKFLWHEFFSPSEATQVKSQGIINSDSCHLRTKGWPDSLPPTRSSTYAN